MGAAIITLNPYLWRSSVQLYSGSISQLKDMKRVSVSNIMFHFCSPTFYKKISFYCLLQPANGMSERGFAASHNVVSRTSKQKPFSIFSAICTHPPNFMSHRFRDKTTRNFIAARPSLTDTCGIPAMIYGTLWLRLISRCELNSVL